MSHLPGTYAGGYTNFNRYFFAQVDKEAAIIDERYNGGGDVADYVIDYLRRPLLSYWNMREGKDITTPIEAIFGPKVMITNEMAGSGGDALPWMFRKTGIGPLVGKRTWGGLVGHYTNPGDLLDGGFAGTPDLAFYSPDGTWDVDNHGVPPDVEVEDGPQAVAPPSAVGKGGRGRDGVVEEEPASGSGSSSALSELPEERRTIARAHMACTKSLRRLWKRRWVLFRRRISYSGPQVSF